MRRLLVVVHLFNTQGIYSWIKVASETFIFSSLHSGHHYFWHHLQYFSLPLKLRKTCFNCTVDTLIKPHHFELLNIPLCPSPVLYVPSVSSCTSFHCTRPACLCLRHCYIFKGLACILANVATEADLICHKQSDPLLSSLSLVCPKDIFSHSLSPSMLEWTHTHTPRQWDEMAQLKIPPDGGAKSRQVGGGRWHAIHPCLPWCISLVLWPNLACQCNSAH